MASVRNLNRQHHIFLFLLLAIILTIFGIFIVTYTFRHYGRMRPISNFTKPTTLPKYFAIDLDDTFYTDNADSMKKNIDAFKLLKTKNVTAFFCTGRDLNCTTKLVGDYFVQETGYNGYPGVYANGAVVYDSDGNVVKMEKFTNDFLDKFKSFVDNNDLSDKTIFFTENGSYTLKPLYQKGIEFMNKRKMIVPEVIDYNDLKNKNVISISFPCPNKEFDIKDLQKGVDYQVKFCYDIIAQLSPTSCNKKEGIETLLKHIETKPEECAYIGDGPNDIESMEYCGLSFAVANAVDKAKEKADWVLDLTYDQGAFAKVVSLLYN